MLGKISFSQSFPSPASLSTGQGILGADDPNWFVSQQCFASGSEPNPTDASVTYSPAVILSTVPSVWINPSTLPAPVNNGNWIGLNATAGSDDAGGCARYYRLPINLPANCGTVSVTSPGAYSLVFDGYVDNTLMKVFLNGVNIGVPSGGSFTAGNQLTFTVSGPWLVGMNYLDILVENGVSVPPNPAGFLMVASPSASSTDSDGDGVNNLTDACPCEAGATANGCPPPNQCNVAAIRTAFLGAGCTELFSCYDGCSLYFYYPTAGSSQSAETFAQSLGGHVVSIQSAAENTCLQSELSSNGFSGVIWLGYTDDVTEGTHYWLDGSPVGYINWSSGEPNNSGGNEDCVQMYPDGMWNDLDCSSGAASILEVGLCPQATAISNTLQVCLGSSATLSVSTLFGSAPYNYTWLPNVGLSSNTGSTVIASPSVTTTYTVASVDRYNCTTYTNITVTVNPSPSLSINAPVICRGQQTATLIAGGANSYSWSPVTGLSSTTGSLVIGNPTITTLYTVTGYDALGCSSSTATIIKVNNVPNVTVVSSNTAICVGQQVSNLSAGGALSYSWTPSTGLSATVGANVIANPLITTTYSVGGINGFGCPNFTTTTIVVNPLPLITANTASICLGQQTATLIVNGASTYAWAPNTGLSSTTGSVVTASPNASTTYSIFGTDANGCSNYITTNLTIRPLPIITSNSASLCIGQQSATLIASGAISYSWTPTTDLSTTTSSVVVASPTASITYTVGGIDANGCVNYTTATVSMLALPIITVSSPSICVGQQTATLTAIGANTYTWIPTTDLSSSTGSLVTATPSITATYTIDGTDTNGCYNSTTNTVTVFSLPNVSVNNSSICIGQQTATLTATGANTYSWFPTLNTGSIINVSPTTNMTYTVIGSNLLGCLNYSVSSVTIYTLPIIVANTPTICIGQQTATLSATGADTYTWISSSQLTTFTGSLVTDNPTVTTTYSIMATDLNGCLNTSVTEVFVNELPVIIVSSSSVCPGQFPANILVIGGINYSWTPTVTFIQPNGSDIETNPSVPTDYTVTGIDANGCTNTATTNVGFYIIPVASYVIDDSVLCIGDGLVITPSGGTAYELQPDNFFTLDEYVLFPEVTTSYTLVAFSDDGCFSINDPVITVTVNPLPTITAFSNTIINIGQTTSLNANGGVTYQWNPTSGLTCANCAVTNARPLENTYYVVTGYDANGCVNTDTVYVQVDFICGEYFVPNAFTPNGDGVNDFLNLHSACIGTYTFQIFDRWGEKVFETSDTKYSWNGTFRGKPMNTAVFMYKAEGFDLKGSPFSVKGNVTLLR